MFLLLVACSQILLYIHKSMMKTTQKYMGKGVLSSLAELGKTGRECCFIRKKLAYWCQKEGITKETVLHTRRVLIKQMKVVACGPETREDSGWDWRSPVKVLYQEKEEGQKNFSWWTGAFLIGTPPHDQKYVAWVTLCVYLVAQPFPLFATTWTVAHQASLSAGFSRQQYWSG